MALFYNQATLSYNGNVTASNITTGEIIEVLSASKDAVIDNYSQDRDTVYVISIINTGTEDYTGLTVSDDLGAYQFGDPAVELVPLTYTDGSVNYYVNGVQQPAPAVTSASPLLITGINVPAGGSALIIYSARANSYAPLGADAEITNTATITGPGIYTPITASATVTALNAADLAISKSLNPSTVPENGQLNYTFIIQNYGSIPACAVDDIIFRDAFDPVISCISVSFNDTPWTAGINYTYDQTTGIFTSNSGQITVPAAVYSQDPFTGEWAVQPGTCTLVISGTIASGVNI